MKYTEDKDIVALEFQAACGITAGFAVVMVFLVATGAPNDVLLMVLSCVILTVLNLRNMYRIKRLVGS